jgi:hypothetical protein
MRYSILHISDLHRDLADELENGPLLDSLVRDIRNYPNQEPPILQPSICIVSGDLIYGVKPGTKDSDTELERQYQQALEFLTGLADELFGGERDRVVLLPGNHDVSYPKTIASSTRIDIAGLSAAEHKILVAELFAPRSSLRWSWSEMCFFRIIDQELYHRRFEHFSRTYAQFYSDARTFSFKPADQFALFDYPDLNLSIAALNSCHRNDPMNRAGAFHPDAITSACRELGQTHRSGRLLAAAWHHSVGGGPLQNDFLDHEFSQLLIDNGVSLGFHGHQHMHDCVDERYRLGPTQRKMTIVSASTLCADATHLRPGIPRGYNVVEINTDTWKGTTHSRHMVNTSPTMPIWGAGHFYATGRSFVDFVICQPLAHRPRHLDTVLALERADEFMRNRQWAAAVQELTTVRTVPMAKPLLLNALTELGDDKATIEALWPPESSAEIVLVGAAILTQQSKDRAQEFLGLKAVSGSTDSSVKETRRRVALRWSK